MKYLIIIIFFIVGCNSEQKFKKIKHNPEDTKITQQKILNTVDPLFNAQQKIDKKIREIGEKNEKK